MDEKKECKEIEMIYNKILQAYRIRYGCMQKRDAQLKKVGYNAEKVLDPEIKKVLETCISREKKLLEIARNEERYGVSILSYAKKTLRKVKSDLKKKNIPNFKMSVDQLLRFFDYMIELLEYMEKEIQKVEKRMSKEENALKSNKPEDVREFMKEWLLEVKENDKIIEAYRKVVHENRTILQKTKWMSFKKGPNTRETLAMILGGASTAGVTPVIGVPVLLIGVGLWVSRNFLIRMQPIMNYEFVQNQADLKLLENIK